LKGNLEMRLPEKNIQTESFGVIESSSFGIGNVGIILDILRTKIYTNPILAVCREISCNARDAHREVNKPGEPIIIYLPNDIEPTLKIKDFGPGISPSRMKDVFINFGASTKREDNIQLGGFGIGAKSVFAYGQSCAIETIVDGVKYQYSAYIDETNVGKMDLMRRVNTDEKNGTTIIIPIKADDFDKVTNTIMECTKHWEVRPTIKGGQGTANPEYPQMIPLYSGTDWTIYSQGQDHAVAILDGIQYRIDKYTIDYYGPLGKILDSSVCMHFNVGELSLAASRDTLQYDDRTKKALEDRLKVVQAELKQQLTDRILTAPSYVEACRSYLELKGEARSLVESLGEIKWNDQPIRERLDKVNVGKWSKIYTYTLSYGDIAMTSSDSQNSTRAWCCLPVRRVAVNHRPWPQW